MPARGNVFVHDDLFYLPSPLMSIDDGRCTWWSRCREM